MKTLLNLWNHLEEGLVALFLTAMTLVTFVYVMFNNLYVVFYAGADAFPALEDPLFAIGDVLLDTAQAMTWSSALTRACFGWLIFLGISYGIRTGAHIGVDLLVRTFSAPLRRACSILVLLIVLGYAVLMMVSSYDWVAALHGASLGAEDLDEFHVMQWHIAMIVPLGFALVIARLVEAFVLTLRGEQNGLQMADEAADALKLASDVHPDTSKESRS
ncbi:TRAP transporter small permease [Kushneria phyllosphaerae]|uniref:TRAP transporter small permease protein n=1 Tax=Kushneria phyllosphaerae TaxID=2100822 RepID=A0A2R8CJA4_9GAMM|nr:TRAP transporter small permease [Kushneria phyllosphaerae]SPJ32997.1 C4-dicarboxylate TRAP transporter small permease protein DctQ [Kushneria phyllosphaerae]